MAYRPAETMEELFQIAFGYMASKALFAALHLGVFEALASGPRSLEELVAETGTEERGLSTLVTALTGIGLLEPRDGGWANAPAVQDHLISGGFGDYLRYQVDRQMYPFMHHLTDVLRGRRDTVPFRDYEAWFGDAEQASLYSEAQHGISLAPAQLLDAQVDLSQRRRLLDVGGGSGGFSITLCQLHPQLEATIVDFPNVLEVARKRVAEAGLEGRIGYLPGNALEVDWPPGRDVALFSYVSGSVSAEGVEELYRRAHGALVPGGIALIHDFLVDDDRTGPPLTALWALQHATFTPGAVSLTPRFVTDALERAGFVDVAIAPFVPGMTRLVQARRPD